MSYRVVARVKEVRGGRCAMGYQPGDALVDERFCIKEAGRGACLHALTAMLAPPVPLLKGVPATALENEKMRTQDTRGAPVREKRAEGRWHLS
ncbi:MAG: hypothetical protein LM590_15885 [Thermofilum sp.]|jgi:uncharacterized repeat protein (TIGR04076 family)|nr:hypothetical protein [Thermofilum sp.]